MIPADPPELNRKLPLWYQVAQHLRATIVSRGPEDSPRLPVEEDLAAYYGVSVVTMRQALKVLADEGIIERLRRHGTFVRPAAGPSPPLTLHGSVDAVVAQQAAEEVEVLAREEVPVPDWLAAHYPDTDRLVYFRRLRRHGGQPVSCADNWLRPEHAAAIDTGYLREFPMTQALREQAGVEIGRIDNRIEARLATPELVELLDVGLLSPILRCECLSFDRAGRGVDAGRLHYRGDRFSYAVTVQAD